MSHRAPCGPAPAFSFATPDTPTDNPHPDSMLKRLAVNISREFDRAKRKLLAPPGMKELPPEFPQDFSAFTRKLWETCGPYTMTSKERMAVLEQSVRYVAAARVPGAIVECGVGPGGSMMAAATVLQEMGDAERDIYLFDTFAGMSEPTKEDVSVHGKQAMVQYKKRLKDGVCNWISYGKDEVAGNLARTGYPSERLHLIEGMVEDTVPPAEIGDIALLRLDTDWYESTRVEMEHLYPKLVPGGILLVDDYNRWLGSRKAVDDYLAAHRIALFLSRVDDHAVVGVKPRS